MSRKFTSEEIEARIIATGLMPVFFHPDPKVSIKVLQACYQGGLRVFEYTHRGPEAMENFKTMRAHLLRDFPDMVLGIGSITDIEVGNMYLEAGADFIVAPNYDPDLSHLCRQRHVPWIPGCGTMTEILNARKAGAGLIKIFPGNVLGPDFIKSVLGPVSDLKLMPTGGVTTEKENLKAWFKAGVKAVGIGSQLFKKEWIAEGSFKAIEEEVKGLLENIENIKWDHVG